MVGYCNHATMQSCNHAIMQSCNHAIMCRWWRWLPCTSPSSPAGCTLQLMAPPHSPTRTPTRGCSRYTAVRTYMHIATPYSRLFCSIYLYHVMQSTMYACVGMMGGGGGHGGWDWQFRPCWRQETAAATII